MKILYFHLFHVSYYTEGTLVMSKHWKAFKNVVLKCSEHEGCYGALKKLVRNSVHPNLIILRSILPLQQNTFIGTSLNSYKSIPSAKPPGPLDSLAKTRLKLSDFEQSKVSFQSHKGSLTIFIFIVLPCVLK